MRLVNTRLIELLTIALLILSFYGMEAFVPNVYAVSYLFSGPTDSCGILRFNVTNSPSCNQILCSSSLPPPSGSNSYGTSVTVNSIDGHVHQFSYKIAAAFCTPGNVCTHPPDPGNCDDNSVVTTGTNVSTPFTMTTKRSASEYGFSNTCGSYQEDFYVTSVDKNPSCHWGQWGTPPYNPPNNNFVAGANSLCNTEVDCTTAPTLTPTQTPTPTPPSFPWWQALGSDVRNDSGFTDNVPTTAVCNGSPNYYALSYATSSSVANRTPGILFTGNQIPDTSPGYVSPLNWQVGGLGTNAEQYNAINDNTGNTSYQATLNRLSQSGITPIDVTTLSFPNNTCMNLNNCTITNWPSGAYKFQGNVTLTGVILSSNNYVFLIHGNLYIKTPIVAPAGTVDFFTASGDITVDPSVGN